MFQVWETWPHPFRLPKLRRQDTTRSSRDREWQQKQEIPAVSVMTAALENKNRLLVKIDNKIVDCLVDTGAAVTVLGEDLFRSIRDSAEHCEKTINCAVTADGSVLNVTDSGEIDLVINDCSFRTMFHVMPQVPHQLILGMDFFKRHQVVLDFQDDKIIFKNPSKVRVHETLEVPARSEFLFLAKVDRVTNSTEGEFLAGSTLNDLGLVVAHSVGKIVDSMIPIHVMNPSETDIHVQKDTTIGNFCPLTSDDNVTDIEPGLLLSIEDCDSDPPNSDPTVPVNINREGLSKSELDSLQSLIQEHAATFAMSKSDVGRTDVITHDITLEDGPRPRRSVPFRANPVEREIIKQEIDACLESGVIRPSTSAWSSPVVLVKKPDGSNRFCIDYRRLNNVTKSDVYPLPRISDVLDTLGVAKPRYFSALDLQSGYWQVEMGESSKMYTAFTTHCGLYEYNRMPFGLKNAPATFQRLMETVLSSLNWRQCLVYLDDVIVFSQSFEDHLVHLKDAFECIQGAGLKLKPSKCYFAQSEVKYLGHIVTENGIAPCPDKCAAVKEFPTPVDVKSLRGFLGLANYYRKFVLGFSKIAAPLNALLRKDAPFVWSDDCNKAFQELRDALCSPPVLAYPDFTKPFLLTTDASNSAVGGILGQIQDGKERVIQYVGRSMNKHERGYSITEKEGLAIVYCLKVFDPYLRNCKFKIITDHQALKYIFNEKENIGSRVARWAMALQQYDYTVVHRAGKVNENADALSRRHYDQDDEESISPPAWNNMLAIETRPPIKAKHDTAPDHCTDSPPVNRHVTMATDKNPTVSTDECADGTRDSGNDMSDSGNDTVVNISIPGCPLPRLKELQDADPNCKMLIDYLTDGSLPNDHKTARQLTVEVENYAVLNGILYHFWFSDGAQKRKDRCYQQVVIPPPLREEVLAAMHDEMTAAHQGFTRTLLSVKCRFYWKSMARDIENWIKSCRTCSSRNRPGKATKTPMILREVDSAFDTIVIDIVGPLKKSANGNRWILTVEDYLSKWPEAIPLPDCKAHTIAVALLDQVISRHSAPRVILSDRGQNFLSAVVRELCNLFDTKKVHSSAYRPQTQGLVERWHSTLYQMLSKYVNSEQSDWDELLPMCLFAYRTTTATESTELSPFQIIYGREPRLPIEQMLTVPRDLSKSVQEHIERVMTKVRQYQTIANENAAKHHAKMKERHDKTANNVDFNVGDLVWLYVPVTPPGLSRKLIHKWHGPYRIIQRQNDVHFFLRNCDNNKLLPTPVNVNRLKRAYVRELRPAQENDINPGNEIDLTENDLPQDSFENDTEKDTEDTEFWPIEKLIKGRWRKDRLEYLVKWKGCTSKDNSWIAYDDLNDEAREYIEENDIQITGKRPDQR